MEKTELFCDIKEALIDYDSETVKKRIKDAITLGVPFEEIVDVLKDGMDVIGRKFEAGECFVTELIIAGEMMKEAMMVLEPMLKEELVQKLATVVVATVTEDIHDIGKNIFAMLLTTAGFKVIDLGVDVSAEMITKAITKHNAEILGLSALLTTNLTQFPLIIEKLKEEDLRSMVKVIVGGATVTEQFAIEAGVDAYAKTAVEGVNICKAWIKK